MGDKEISVGENLKTLLAQLITLPAELQTVEFKENNLNPEMIGKDISAIANSALETEQDSGYMVWGISDTDHSIVGTSFNPSTVTVGNMGLEIWLRQKLSRNAQFTFMQTALSPSKTCTILRIWAASGSLVSFSGDEYIRSGSSTQLLRNFPQREQRLWVLAKAAIFEEQPAKEWLDLSQALSLLNWSAYFSRLNMPIPDSPNTIAHYLESDDILRKTDSGQYSITNLGALLFAYNLENFPTVARKALRIIRFEGKDRMSKSRSKTFSAGYADMDAMLEYLQALLPEQEQIVGASRITQYAYPSIALRELLANMLIHQDLTVVGAGPMIQIFEDRIEFSNPGASLIETARLVNDPPRSRNPKLASLSRRLGFCEEAGTGWDKIILSCEMAQLPSPDIQQNRSHAESMTVRLMQHLPYKGLSLSERENAVYWHACLQYARGTYMTNASVRERFGLSSSSASQISRLLHTCVEKQIIRPVDVSAAKKSMQYLPAWA